MSYFSGRPLLRLASAGAALALMAGCGGDYGIGNVGPGLSGSNRSVQVEAEPRPAADRRGVLSYTDYQMVEARSGDTVANVARRVGVDAQELADYNGLYPDYRLRTGEILALPRRVSEPGSGVDIAAIAGNAIDRAGEDSPAAPPDAASNPATDPIRHRVLRGETAYSIARLYNVSVRSLAEWNGLGPDFTVREGQYLLIPTSANGAPARAARPDTARPGQGSPSPVPPSASEPLPDAVETATLPASPDLERYQSDGANDSRFLRPVDGRTIRAYHENGNDGIDISAATGTTVRAASEGKVALISRSTGDTTIVLVRHPDNIYTVYSNITDVAVSKGDTVRRGQPVGKVAPGNPGFMHFEVRRGTKAIDPGPYID